MTADFADRDHAPFPDAADYGVHITRRRDQHAGPTTETFSHPWGDLDNLGKIGVVHLFPPWLASAHCAAFLKPCFRTPGYLATRYGACRPGWRGRSWC